MKKLTLIFKGRDNWERPVYEANGRLYVDVNPSSVHAAIHTKSGNDFFGEPDWPIEEGTEIEFIPHRDTWY